MDPAPEVILFYRVNDPYGCFSNFAPYPIELDGKTWPTSEHYFQAQKFPGSPHQEAIRNTPSPMIAKRMGQSKKHRMRPDWLAVRDEAMRVAVRAKFAQHEKIRRLLLGTGNARLVEHTKNDSYWADGPDGTGANRLGEILMEVREELRRAAEPVPGGR